MNLKRSTAFFVGFLPCYAFSSIEFSGFLDTYFSYNLSSPLSYKRSYTTQPSRMSEPQINMAYLDGTLNEEAWRGRLALQYGNSVDANYVLERNKTVQAIQELYLGRKLSDKLWVDAGIFLGNIGAESWISKYNWTYTRALNLDYVPYYSAGVRFEYLASSKQAWQVQILNGWQNIQENNNSKALGIQYRRDLNDKLTFTYNNFLGDEVVVGRKSRFRQYHNFIFKWLFSEQWQFLGAIDLGFQSQQKKSGVDGMLAQTLTVRRIFNPQQSMATRLEYYNDAHQTTVVTNSPKGFEVIGASVNYDHQFNRNIIWRTEARILNSKDKIYPNNKEPNGYNDSIIVTSIGISL